MDSQVEEIKAKTDIVELIGQTVKLTKAGRNYKGLCPFHHEKSSSFIVSPERGTWRCFGCGEHGDAIAFLEKYENLSFMEALEQLAQKAGVELKRQKQDPQRQEQQQRLYQLLQLAANYYHYLLTQHDSGKSAKEYIVARGINDKTIQTFTLGYAPDSWQSVSKFLQQKGFTPSEIARVGISSQNDSGREYDRFRGRLMFPISDSVGRIVGFSGRSLSDSKDVAKYLNSPDTDLFHKGRLLFGLQQAKEGIRNKQRIVLVEGNVDLLSSHQAGITEVVAPLGTALTEDQVLLIKKFTQNVYLAYDQDKAGQAAIWRGLPLLQSQQLNVKVINLPAGQDPDQFIQANPQGWTQAIDSAQEVFLYLLGTLSQDFNLSSAQGKQQAVQKVIPFIASTPDSVAQAFLLHQAADVIGVEEQLLRSRVERWQPDEQAEDGSRGAEEADSNPQSSPPNPQPKPTRQQVLADYFFATALNTSPAQFKSKQLQMALKELKSLAIPTDYRPILIGLQAASAQSSELDLNKLAGQLSGESVEVFDTLSLMPTDENGQSVLGSMSQSPSLTQAGTIPAANSTSSASQSSLGDRLLHIAYQLNDLYLKQRLSQLTEQIKRASILDSHDLADMKKEFTQVSEEIRQLNKKLNT